ncbi:hypothetical protein COOONC_20997 [Cooperia oncophora]
MMEAPVVSAPPPPSSFSKNTKKPSFFGGNWTFRDRKQSRPSMDHDCMRRDDRPMSMNLSESRGARSKSETAARQVEIRVPVKIERAPPADEHRRTRQMSETAAVYKTNITVDDSAVSTPTAVLRPRKELAETNNNSYNYNSSSNPLRKSCPDLDAAAAAALSTTEERGARRRNRRAKEKIKEASWRRKPVEDWALDDVLLWLQACSLDDVASLLIGYDLRGTDLLTWDHDCLSQLGVTSASIREKILKELAAIRERGPEEAKETEKRNGHRALFDIVKQSTYDQVLAVETPLTTRDIIVTHGRLGCLQITKVNGVNLPLRENDCLLEINDCPGEQFKSALMLTKLISDSNGSPIRFVVLRMKTVDRADDSFNETSSSGVSSSPRSPSE